MQLPAASIEGPGCPSPLLCFKLQVDLTLSFSYGSPLMLTAISAAVLFEDPQTTLLATTALPHTKLLPTTLSIPRDIWPVRALQRCTATIEQ